MARHRRRHHGGHGGSKHRFGFVKLAKSAKVKDAGIGLLLGLGGASLAAFGVNKANAARAAAGGNPVGQSFTMYGAPIVGGLVLGGAAYAYKRKKDHSAATAYLLGGVFGGMVIAAFKYLQANYPAMFGDLVKIRLQGHGGRLANVLINQGALGNLIVSAPGLPVQRNSALGRYATSQRMAGLASAAMSPAARSALGGYLRVRA